MTPAAAVKAALVGANTVNGPGAVSAGTRLRAATAETRLENSGLACAICTMFSTPGGTSTLSMTCTMPLLARTSAVTTRALVSTASRNCTPPVVATPSVVAVPPKL
jgi:hypothetical protein